jgi:hypothetical protein
VIRKTKVAIGCSAAGGVGLVGLLGVLFGFAPVMWFVGVCGALSLVGIGVGILDGVL